jgi:hypothetical protein
VSSLVVGVLGQGLGLPPIQPSQGPQWLLDCAFTAVAANRHTRATRAMVLDRAMVLLLGRDVTCGAGSRASSSTQNNN